MSARSFFVFLTVLVFLAVPLAIVQTGCSGTQDAPKKAQQSATSLPGPQLVTGAWMFIAAYKADPEVLKSMLPEGLKPHPNNHVVINMYTVPDKNQTSGFGAYTLTYLTVELEGNDSYVMDADITYPGRYFVHYYNSSPKMREFTKAVGIPVQEGMTTTVVENGVLKTKLEIGGQSMIEATAQVGSELGGFGGGHLNYFGLLKDEGKVVKYPIPWNGGTVSMANPKITFTAPADHPINKLKPLADPTWAIWTKGSFVYPQYQIVN